MTHPSIHAEAFRRVCDNLTPTTLAGIVADLSARIPSEDGLLAKVAREAAEAALIANVGKEEAQRLIDAVE